MTKKSYDFVYLTNTPSFYKLRLCHELARQHSLLLVLLGYGAEAVNENISGEAARRFRFDTVFLHQGDLHRRPGWLVMLRLLRLMRRIRARRILFSGWFVPEYTAFAFLSPPKRNVLICESSALDSTHRGIRGWLKRRILGRMSAALPSGQPHCELMRRLGYRGHICPTGGVGLIRTGKTARRPKHRGSPLRYLFVGRLIAVKNILPLAQVMAASGRYLTIVGEGDLEQQLRSLETPSLRLTGFVPNEHLAEVYRQHDVLILPSLYEPWGLVVEEALYHGLPVMVSCHVGCARDLVVPGCTGEIFDPHRPATLEAAFQRLETDYGRYCEAVDSIDWQQRRQDQLNAYRSLLSSPERQAPK